MSDHTTPPPAPQRPTGGFAAAKPQPPGGPFQVPDDVLEGSEVFTNDPPPTPTHREIPPRPSSAGEHSPTPAHTASSSETATAPPAEEPAPLVMTPKVRAAAQALLNYIADDECSEVLMNGPNECLRKVRGGRWHCPEVAFGDPDVYHQVLNDVVLAYCDTPDRIDGTKVVVEGQLEIPGAEGRPPMLARVHILTPPGVKYAKMTIAKKPRVAITLDDMAANGTMSPEEAEFLKAVARGHKTFVVSGATGAGKSTLLQAMTHHFDMNDRVVVVEETPELQLMLGDVVYLKASLELPGMDPSQIYSLEFWVKQSNRMRMSRVIVGETRGAEMAEWLIAANSGAEGSATTVHADSPRRALDKILTLASKNAGSTSELQIRRDIAETVDLIVQVGFVDGRHVVTAIEEISDTVSSQTGQIQTNTLFAFDRAKSAHVAKGRPSDQFTQSMAAHGVPINPLWFRTSQ